MRPIVPTFDNGRMMFGANNIAVDRGRRVETDLHKLEIPGREELGSK
jgi:hypothetical protein